MAEIEMVTATGTFTVRRDHRAAAAENAAPDTSPLRAWSAADQLALDHLAGLADTPGRVLIVNDEFGALTVALAAASPVLWTDSALSRAAAEANLSANSLDPLAERAVPADQHPTGTFDAVLVRIPKTTALLEFQLAIIATLVSETSHVIGLGMARHIHTSTVELFEKQIGPTTTTRATRKARLILSEPVPSASAAPALDFTKFATQHGVRVAEAPGTFSAGHLDVGSALLIDTILAEHTLGAARRVLDVGCGNGVLAATLAVRDADAHYVLTDVSDLAIAAAHQTWMLNGLADEDLTLIAADGLDDIESDSIDLVITNPPFHQGHALDVDMTDRLLADIGRVLVDGGAAYVVAQRHLHVNTRMQRWFTTVDTLSKHPSHVVIRAIK